MAKTSNHRAVTLLIIACAGLFNHCVAQKSADGNWQNLFNGKDLTGWEMLNAPHKAGVKDGVIVATTSGHDGNGFLCTTQKYGDFILELDLKTDLLLDNTGIQFRSVSDPAIMNGRVHGYQLQIENRPPRLSQWSGAIYEEAGRGFLTVMEDDPVREKAYVQGQWNHIRIESIGTMSRVWINGVPTAHVVDDKSMSGIICLQVHGGTHAAERGPQSAYMKNVRIKTEGLKPSPYDQTPIVNLIPNTLSEGEKHQGFQLLFDGKTSKNWRGVAQNNLPEGGFKVEDGVITVSSSDEEGNHVGKAVAMTEKTYGAFELKFDFKLHNDEAIAGVEYHFDPQSTAKREGLFGKLTQDNARKRAKLDRDIWKPEWNKGVIKVSPNGMVEHWVNGFKILEYKRDNQASKGHILLDAYSGDTVSYRSVKIRELK